MLKSSKRGQVTIFIILAILIVSVVLIFFLWVKPKYIDVTEKTLNFESCVSDVIEKNTATLGTTSGFIEPEFYYLYQGEKFGYLCYTNLYYKLCSVQTPFPKDSFESSLETMSREEITSCYQNSVNELKNQGYDVIAGNIDFNVSIEPKTINVEIDAPVEITKQSTRSFQKLNVLITSNIYEMLMVTTSIIQYETGYGDADTNSFMVFYPDLAIDKLKQSEGTTIYIITDKNTQLKYQFASRSLAWPPGYGISSGLIPSE